MPRKTTVTVNPENEVSEVTDNITVEVSTENTPVNLPPADGGNLVLAAWRGLYHLLGARCDKFIITNEGAHVENLTLDPKYNTQRVLDDLHKAESRRRGIVLKLIPTYFWVQGMEPDPFTTANEMTQWMAEYFRKNTKDETGTQSAPKYVKEAISEYKKAFASEYNFVGRRGRPKNAVNYKIEEILANPDVLKSLPIDQLEALRRYADDAEKQKEETAA